MMIIILTNLIIIIANSYNNFDLDIYIVSDAREKMRELKYIRIVLHVSEKYNHANPVNIVFFTSTHYQFFSINSKY